MECLINAGSDFNRGNSDGLTPLHAACFNGQRDAISLLLSKSATLSNFRALTPLDLCLEVCLPYSVLHVMMMLA